MSRTIRRRKEAEQLVSNHGGKIAGVYTEVDYVYNSLHGHPCLPVYREPTKTERYQTWRTLHGERHMASYRFQRGLHKWARRVEHKAQRAKNERLIANFLRGKTDDVVAYIARRCPMQYW